MCVFGAGGGGVSAVKILVLWLKKYFFPHLLCPPSADTDGFFPYVLINILKGAYYD